MRENFNSDLSNTGFSIFDLPPKLAAWPWSSVSLFWGCKFSFTPSRHLYRWKCLRIVDIQKCELLGAGGQCCGAVDSVPPVTPTPPYRSSLLSFGFSISYLLCANIPEKATEADPSAWILTPSLEIRKEFPAEPVLESEPMNKRSSCVSLSITLPFKISKPLKNGKGKKWTLKNHNVSLKKKKTTLPLYVNSIQRALQCQEMMFSCPWWAEHTREGRQANNWIPKWTAERNVFHPEKNRAYG